MKMILHCSYLHPVDDSRIMRYVQYFKIEHKIVGVKSRSSGFSLYELDKNHSKINRLFLAINVILKINFFNSRNKKTTINIVHDPFLLIFAPFIRLTGGVVIFDAHEDIPQNLMMRGSSKLFSSIVAMIIYLLIKIFCKFSIVCVDSQRKRWYFPQNSIFQNFANINTIEISRVKDPNKIIYVGNLSKERGAYKILDLADKLRETNLYIVICGKIDDKKIEVNFENHEKIQYHGWLPSEELVREIKSSIIGISLLENNDAYYYSYPLKIIDYIRFGIPFVSTPNLFAEQMIKEYGIGTIAQGDEEIGANVILMHANINFYVSKYKEYNSSILSNFHIENDSNLEYLND